MRTIKDILIAFISKFANENEFYSTRAKVISNDLIKNTCTVETIDNKSEIVKVQFLSYIGATLGFLLIPEIDSIVTVSFYSPNEAYISKASVLSKLKMLFKDDQQNEISFLIDDTGIYFNGGLLGGLVKLAEMTSRFNDLESLHNTLQSNFSSWTPAPNDGGAALKTIITTGYVAETVPNSQGPDFENEKVKQ